VHDAAVRDRREPRACDQRRLRRAGRRPLRTGALAQYTVGPGGTLTPSLPATALPATPQDIAITPDGRFAYVAAVGAASPATVAQFARVAANGRLEPNGTGPSADASAILVNPQGTRVVLGQGNTVSSRPINADGTLGAPSTFAIPGAAARPACGRSR